MSDFNLGPDDFDVWADWLAYVDRAVELELNPAEIHVRYQLVLMRVWIADNIPEISL